ncbi:MAG: thioredoxin family protein [bacterium]|nr:thioredoxin family protein [bacterium]
MKQIKILGTGCAKCTKLAETTEKAAQELNIQYELEKITDMDKIMEFGVMTTPAIVVDGQVKVAGSIPKIDMIKEMLK